MKTDLCTHTSETGSLGFTLLEILLTVAVIAGLAGLSAPVFQNFQSRNNLELGSQTIVESLRRAQILSQAMQNDSAWGVHIDAGEVVIFQGSSFASRDTDYDETIEISGNITISGQTDIVFSKFTGLPQTTGNITLTDSAIDETKTITINSQGTLLY